MAEQESTAPDPQAGDAAAAPPLPDLGTSLALSDEASTTIEMLGDVDLRVTVELGRTEMLVEDVLRLAAGSVVELDKLAGDPVDVYVNDRLIARGEVLVLNDNFCIRVSEIVDDLQQQAQAAIEDLHQEGEAA
jgi:flagellar motor switch protein FliN/FliY